MFKNEVRLPAGGLISHASSKSFLINVRMNLLLPKVTTLQGKMHLDV